MGIRTCQPLPPSSLQPSSPLSVILKISDRVLPSQKLQRPSIALTSKQVFIEWVGLEIEQRAAVLADATRCGSSQGKYAGVRWWEREKGGGGRECRGVETLEGEMATLE